MRLAMIMVCVGGVAYLSLAQDTASKPASPFTVHNASEIASRSQRLVSKALTTPEGFSGETLERSGNSYTMLAARVRQGNAEVHVHTGDYFEVLQGHATEVFGGTLVEGKETAPGELRGSAILGGEKRLLGPGDVVHIAANTPHQTLMSGEPFVYFVIKVEE